MRKPAKIQAHLDSLSGRGDIPPSAFSLCTIARLKLALLSHLARYTYVRRIRDPWGSLFPAWRSALLKVSPPPGPPGGMLVKPFSSQWGTCDIFSTHSAIREKF